MCSGARSSSANGAMARRASSALGVVDLQQQRLVALDDQRSIRHVGQNPVVDEEVLAKIAIAMMPPTMTRPTAMA